MEQTYAKGEYVRYGYNGVCLIEDIRCDTPSAYSAAKEFYILKPIGATRSTIFVPLDNELLLSKMERLPSREEIDALILSSQDNALDWIDNRKDRAARFQAMVKDCKLQDLLVLVSCIFRKKQELLTQGKKLSATDEAILRRAEGLVENELAFVLRLPSSQVRPYIQDKLNNAAAL